MTFSLDAIGTYKTATIKHRAVSLPSSVRAELNGFVSTIFYGEFKYDLGKVDLDIDSTPLRIGIHQSIDWDDGDVVVWEASPGILRFIKVKN